jgi:hypothetical protein
MSKVQVPSLAPSTASSRRRLDSASSSLACRAERSRGLSRKRRLPPMASEVTLISSGTTSPLLILTSTTTLRPVVALPPSI